GFRSDIESGWSFPGATHSMDRLLWEQHVTGTYWDRHNLPRNMNSEISEKLRIRYGLFPPALRPWQTVRDVLTAIPHLPEDHGIHDHIFRDGARSYPGHTGSDIDQPAKTIKAGGHGVPGGENMVRTEDGALRYFTTFEAKLIQTFPRD